MEEKKSYEKSLLFVLVVAFVIATFPASAATNKFAKFSDHSTIDLTPFEKASYECSFDDMKYTAEIKATGTKATDDESNITLYFDIKMVYMPETGASFSPRLILTSDFGIDTFQEAYIKVGENRYRVAISGASGSYSSKYGVYQSLSGVIPFGATGISVLEEMATSGKTISICTNAYPGKVFNLPNTTVAQIQQFYQDCKTSGLFEQPLLQSAVDDFVVITQFN